jgi:hypothetical protein
MTETSTGQAVTTVVRTTLATVMTIVRRTVTVVATTQTETRSKTKAAIEVSSIMTLTALRARAQTYITYILFHRM